MEKLSQKQTARSLESSSAIFLSKIMRDLRFSVEGFQSVAQTKYFSKNISIYEDSDGIKKLALSIVFVQSFSSEIEGLEDKVFQRVSSLLSELKLEETINDVVVNLLHSHNGKIQD